MKLSLLRRFTAFETLALLFIVVVAAVSLTGCSSGKSAI
jgi:hypothetical protein